MAPIVVPGHNRHVADSPGLGSVKPPEDATVRRLRSLMGPVFLVAFVTMIGTLVYKVQSGRKELWGFGLLGLAGVPMMIALGLQVIARTPVEGRRRATGSVVLGIVATLIALRLISL